MKIAIALVISLLFSGFVPSTSFADPVLEGVVLPAMNQGAIPTQKSEYEVKGSYGNSELDKAYSQYAESLIKGVNQSSRLHIGNSFQIANLDFDNGEKNIDVTFDDGSNQYPDLTCYSVLSRMAESKDKRNLLLHILSDNGNVISISYEDIEVFTLEPIHVFYVKKEPYVLANIKYYIGSRANGYRNMADWDFRKSPPQKITVSMSEYLDIVNGMVHSQNALKLDNFTIHGEAITEGVRDMDKEEAIRMGLVK